MKVRPSFQIFLSCIIILFGGLIFLGFSVIDSPAKMQLRNNDAKRINDLKEVANIMLRQHEAGKALADSVVEATRSDSTRNFMQDPFSAQKYDYRRISEFVFELCAVFETSNIDYGDGQSFYYSDQYINLAHEEGRQCFSFDLNADSDE